MTSKIIPSKKRCGNCTNLNTGRNIVTGKLVRTARYPNGYNCGIGRCPNDCYVLNEA
jgi:hypothetical protein